MKSRMRSCLVLLVVFLPLLSCQSPAATFTVTNAADTATPGTFRWAILSANTNPGPDTVAFGLITPPYIIRPTSQLPTVTNGRTTIDGTTQTGYSGVPIVNVHGSLAGGGANGLLIWAGTCTVKGITVCGFSDDGISLNAVSSNTIQGCYIMSNYNDGVDIYNSSRNLVGGTNVLQRNVISSNGQSGVYIEFPILLTTACSSNIVIGNFIGTTADGMTAQPNMIGVYIYDSRFNIIGSAQPGTRNVISGNARGVDIEGTNGWGNSVQNNYIGVASNGTTRLANTSYGIYIENSRSNTIGGVSSSERNIISGNRADGVRIYGNMADNNVLMGNYIGLDSTGSGWMSNEWDGVYITQAPSNRIGGAVSGAGNVISGNDYGIYLQGTAVVNTVIQGNTIGLNAAGTAARGNLYGGVYVEDGSRCRIGGTNTEARNVVSGNQGTGINIPSPYGGHVIEGNYIGTDVSGMVAVTNLGHGIGLNSPSSRVGGTNVLQRNVIAGNSGTAVALGSTNAVGTGIFGNYLGMDITGTNVMPNDNGVMINGGAKQIKVGGDTPQSGNVISGNNGQGIYILSLCREITVQNNFIGTDAGGTVAKSNGQYGIYVGDLGPGSHIGVAGGGNVISANYLDGARIYNATGLSIRANLVGLNTNFVALGNRNDGMRIERSDGLTIGGAGAAERNTIAGNGGYGLSLNKCSGGVVAYNYIGITSLGLVCSNSFSGVQIDYSRSNRFENNVISGNGQRGVDLWHCTNHIFVGNFIGTDPTGLGPVGNAQEGIYIGGISVSNVIGMNWTSGNTISGNGMLGIWLDGSEVRYTFIAGNSIGVNLPGTSSISNGTAGIYAYFSSFNRIGGTNALEFNVISGNGRSGVLINGDTAHDNLVQNNIIGMDSTKTKPIHNGECGVWIGAGACTNMVGGPGTYEGNTIAYNREQGVLVADANSTANIIAGNSIFGNSLLGIDLGDDGVTPNDNQDPDLGANRLQNYPVLLWATNDGTWISFAGYLNSLPFTSFVIELFGNDQPNLSGYGEGQILLARFGGASDANGNAGFTNTIASSTPPPNFMTATALAVGPNDSSEFSQRLFMDADRDGMGDGYEYTYSGGAGVTNLDPNGHLDADGMNNLEEFLGNTDPTDTESVTKFSSILNEFGDRVITWWASGNRNYNLQTCSDLGRNPPIWSDHPAPQYRNTNSISVYDGNLQNLRLWRVEAQVP